MRRRTFADARAIARAAVFSSAAAHGRGINYDAEDDLIGRTLLCRLLWHVEAEDGGFIGLTDQKLEDFCARHRLDLVEANRFAWSRGDWPDEAIGQRRAA